MSDTITAARRETTSPVLLGRSDPLERILATLAADPSAFVSVVAERGVGRTALLGAVRDRLEEEGRGRIHWISGSRSLTDVPLGALAPLLAELGVDAGTGTTLVDLHRALADSRVLIVDDAHLLDEVSCGVITQLVQARKGRQGVAVVASTAVGPAPTFAGGRSATRGAGSEAGVLAARAARPLPSGDLEIALAPLSADEQRSLVAAVLVEAHPRVVDELLRLAHGSTRILVALVETLRDEPDALDASTSVVERLRLTPSIVDALPVDPFSASDPIIDLLSLLAVCGPLPLELGGEPGASETSSIAAESLGLVRSYEEDGRRWVELAHPVYEPVMLMAVSPLRRYGFFAAGADMLSGCPQHRVRYTLHRLRAGIPVDPTELDVLAREELRAQRYSTALTLGEHAVLQSDDDPLLRASGLAIRAQAASQIGRVDEATAWFSEAWACASEASVPPTQEFLARLAQAEGNHLAFRLARPALAVERVETILERIHDPRWRAFVDPDLVKWRLMAGEGLPESIHDLPVLSTVQTAGDLNLLIMTAMVQTMGGSIEAARTAVQRGLKEADRFADVLPNARDLLRLSEVLALAFGGDVAAATRESRKELALAETANPSARGMWEFVLAIIELHAGCPARGWKLIGDARRDLIWRDIAGLLPTAEAVHAALAARTGRFAMARRWLDAHPSTEAADPKVALYAQLARAWVAASAGRPGYAVRTLATTVADAVDRGQLYLGALCAYEGVRIDPIVGATVMLPHLARAQNAFPAALAHARTLTARGDVLPVARRLAEAALLGPAIDAARWCAETAKDRVRQAEATRLADAWTVRSGVALAPRRTDTQPRMTPLTDREWQLASGAAALRTSAELAAEYGISVRTVDNHLSRIYRKLGISGRRELAAELGMLSAENPWTRRSSANGE